MRFLQAMGVGEKFRPAHPQQLSLNNLKMHQNNIFRITKIFPMSPYIVISILDNKQNNNFFSLNPKTPVLFPKESNPTEKKIMEFLGIKVKHKVVAYRVLWDGQSCLTNILAPQAVAAMKLLFSVGRGEYSHEEINRLFITHYSKFWTLPMRNSPQDILGYYRRILISKGLLEEIVDSAEIPEALFQANLQHTY